MTGKILKHLGLLVLAFGLGSAILWIARDVFSVPFSFDPALLTGFIPFGFLLLFVGRQFDRDPRS